MGARPPFFVSLEPVMLKFLENPTFLRHFHAGAVIVWILLIIPTVLFWKEAILWLAIMSVWANIAAHWSAWQAARAETKDDE